MDGFEWDPAKAAANLAKHHVDFADAALSLEDPRARTVPDPDSTAEERFITLAADPQRHSSGYGIRLCCRKPPHHFISHSQPWRT
jgi:uncharacterized DUF497 family protein